MNENEAIVMLVFFAGLFWFLGKIVAIDERTPA